MYKVSLKNIKDDWKNLSVKIQKIGQEHGPHSDAGPETLGYNPAGEVDPYLSTVTCLTQDYDGGYFEMPEFNISVKLKIGSTIVYPSINHEHQVTKVTDGERRTLLGFWYI
jgi:predicted 2-oxoglutarate/Fe(II)-dependent dioxygenase YbiX